MVTRQYQRWKGRKYEYDCLESVQQKYPNTYLTAERGFVKQWDLQNDDKKFVIECKKHKSISWNQAKKWFFKLQDKSPQDYDFFLLFQSNQQPCLVMSNYKWNGETINDEVKVLEFETFFGFPFIKHKPIKKR